jgi:hypothetical protein
MQTWIWLSKHLFLKACKYLLPFFIPTFSFYIALGDQEMQERMKTRPVPNLNYS